MKIAKKQVHRINSECQNNWEFDLYYFVCHSEKTLIKQVELNNTCYLQFRLEYNSRNQIILHMSRYTKIDNDIAISTGLGKIKILNEIAEPRKITSKLVNYTAELTNERLLEISKHI